MKGLPFFLLSTPFPFSAPKVTNRETATLSKKRPWIINSHYPQSVPLTGNITPYPSQSEEMGQKSTLHARPTSPGPCPNHPSVHADFAHLA